MSEKKALRVEVKDAGEGTVQAVFATLNVVDLDGDVTLPGAFKDGQEVRISAYGHASWGSALPVGKGVIRASDAEAVLDGRFFMDTQQGRDTFLTVKELGPLGQWSYGFDVLDAEEGDFEEQKVRFLKSLDVHEVSPVLLGAGIDTRTVAVKSQGKAAIASHSTATTDAAWDGPANEANLKADGDAAYYRTAYAWADPEGDPETKAGYRFIHHTVSGDGTVGAADTIACVTGIGVLNGARGGTTIPDADRQGVYNHLARHLRDAGAEPPELRSKSFTLPDHVGFVLGDTAAVLDRVQAFGSRSGSRKEGRVLSTANHRRLTAMASALLEAHGALVELLAETDPGKQRADLEREFLRYQRALSASH